MKLLHLADTHLGYSAYRKVTEDGVNLREMDVYDAFVRCIDYAVKTKPDVVLHAGDLFDSVRPTNRAITVALQQILRLSEANIPFVVISGNHETPRLKETGNIFSIFEHLPNVYPIFQNHYEKITLNLPEETITVHAIPQCQSPQEFDGNIKKITLEKNADRNVLLAHGAVAGIKEFKMNEFNELFIPVQTLHQKFDYIALGHYHTYTKLEENAFYCGSTEHLTFTEANDQKGLLEIDLKKKHIHRFIPIQTRTMIDLPPLDCSALNIEQIQKQIKDTIQSIDPKEKVVRIRLQNIPGHIQRGLDVHQIQDWGKNAVHCEIKYTTLKTDNASLTEGYTMKSLSAEFEKYLSTQTISEREMILKLGLRYIQKIEEQDGNV